MMCMQNFDRWNDLWIEHRTGSHVVQPVAEPARGGRNRIKEDTIGMPMDYVEYGVVDDEYRLLPPGETGELVLRVPRHLMFDRYLDDEAGTRHALRGGFFHTGDRMSISPRGCWHSGAAPPSASAIMERTSIPVLSSAQRWRTRVCTKRLPTACRRNWAMTT